MFHVGVNETLSVVLITNLLKNAFEHNIDRSVVKIEISASSVRIGNSGVDKTLNGKCIFEHFYQGINKKGSTGLGLAIVYSICCQSQLRIRYKFVKDMHWMVLFVNKFLSENILFLNLSSFSVSFQILFSTLLWEKKLKS